MSLFKLLTNTIEGAVQVPLAAAKAAAGAVLLPLDDGETVKDGLADVVEGARKIGDAGDSDDTQ